MTRLLAALHAAQPVLNLLCVLFLVVLVGCWIRYGVQQFRAWRSLWLGRDGRRRRRGEQPLCEFTSGPVGNGLFWHDQVLVEVVAEFERDLGMGGVR